MFRWIHFGFAGLTIAGSLPFLAISLLIALLCLAILAALPAFVARRGVGGLDFQQQWAEDEFRFEEAIRSYEDLIDANVRRRR